MIAVLIATLGGLIQGNWHKFVGRFMVIAGSMVAALYGPLDGVWTNTIEAGVILGLGAAVGLNTVLGYTDWSDLRYSLIRYTAPLLGCSILASIAATGRPELVLVTLAGPLCAVIWYYIGEHKPQWLEDLTDLDVARPLACFVSALAMWLV